MTDEDYMKLAFAVARRAGANGNPTFGSILVDKTGEVVLEAENDVFTESDCTGHAETNLIRAASRRFGVGALGDFTMYTSAEPCGMCGVAAFWSGLERIVFGLSLDRLIKIRSDGPPILNLPIREIASRSPRPIEVTGPVLEDDAAALFSPTS